MLKRLVRRNEKNGAKIYPSGEYTLNFDGASKGNPGLAGTGMVIYKNKEEIWSSCKFIGCKTNNQAEYTALIFGLKGALELGIKNLSVLGDSLLVINQVNGIYRVKSELLAELHKEVIDLKRKFDYIEFNHVYRENNKRADHLSNLALENIGDNSNTQVDNSNTQIDNSNTQIDNSNTQVANSNTQVANSNTQVANSNTQGEKINKELEKTNEYKFEDIEIKELEEEWIEEIKLTEENLKVNRPKSKEKPKTRISEKQSAITEFFKLNPLFPNIN
jgi:ribonuclease HI